MKPKPIEQISAWGGTLIKLFYSVGEAAKAADVSYSKMLELIKTGALYNHYRYKPYGEPMGKKTTFYPIQQYDKNTNETINEFKTIVEAAETLGIGRNIISRHIKNGTPDSDGYYWRKV